MIIDFSGIDFIPCVLHLYVGRRRLAEEKEALCPHWVTQYTCDRDSQYLALKVTSGDIKIPCNVLPV